MRNFFRAMLVGAGLFAGMWAIPSQAAEGAKCVTYDSVYRNIAGIAGQGFEMTAMMPEKYVKAFLKELVAFGKTRKEDKIGPGMAKIGPFDRVDVGFDETGSKVVIVLGRKPDCALGGAVLNAQDFDTIIKKVVHEVDDKGK